MFMTAICGCGHQFEIEATHGVNETECPVCGRIVDVTWIRGDTSTAEKAVVDDEISDTNDSDGEENHRGHPSDSNPSQQTPEAPVLLRLLLNPKTIERLLIFGGSLSVLGLIAWLISLGVFEDPRVLAGVLGAGTLALLAGGWGIALRTPYRLAGQALTFLACVVAPLNLWFYDAQGLLTVDGHLWVGGLVCSLLYMLTVWKLRDPLFLYAVEAGITMTVLLLLGDLHHATDSSALCLAMVVLAVISIHAQAAFDVKHLVFSRHRFGLPLFFSGQVQLGIGMISLLVLQILNWTFKPALGEWSHSQIAITPWLAGSLWLAAAYLWSYSDLAVRRLSIYTYLAALAVVLGEVSVIYPVMPLEILIIALSMTALVVQLMTARTAAVDSRLSTVITNVTAMIGAVTFGLGMTEHFRSVVSEAETIHDPKLFAVALFAVAMNVFAYGTLQTGRRSSVIMASWIGSGVSLWLATAYGLTAVGIQATAYQLPLLMMIPIAIVFVTTKFSTRPTINGPLVGYATATFGLLLSFFSTRSIDERLSILTSGSSDPTTLCVGLTFLELAILNFTTQTKSKGRWFSLGCGGVSSAVAIWKLLVFIDLPEVWLSPLFAVVGFTLLVVDRMKSTISKDQLVGGEDNRQQKQTPIRIASSLSLTVGELIAFFQTLSLLFVAIAPVPPLTLIAIMLTAAVSFAASFAAMPSRSWHRFASIMVAIAISLVWIRALQLADYQKLELALEAAGIAWLIAGFAGRVSEIGETRYPGVSWALWSGSLMSTIPVFFCTVMHRFWSSAPSQGDEFGLLTITILMVAIGCVLQIRSTTSIGGVALGLYLAILFGSLVYHPQVAIGVYLAAGGAVIFLTGVILSVYRDRLLALPSRIAQREGIFQLIDWR